MALMVSTKTCQEVFAYLQNLEQEDSEEEVADQGEEKILKRKKKMKKFGHGRQSRKLPNIRRGKFVWCPPSKFVSLQSLFFPKRVTRNKWSSTLPAIMMDRAMTAARV